MEISEAELALKFIQHFEGFEIFKEVNSPGGGICDIVLKMGKLLVAVEVKKTFNVEVIYQALRHKPYCHYTYVAIPRLKAGIGRNWKAEQICKELGIGVLYYEVHERYMSSKIGTWKKSGLSNVTEYVQPTYNRPSKAIFKLHEWQKRSVAGSQTDRLTPFKITIEEIVADLNRAGGYALAKDFFKNNRYHYGSISSAKQCLAGLCRNDVIKEFRFCNGYITTLTEEKLNAKLGIIRK